MNSALQMTAIGGEQEFRTILFGRFMLPDSTEHPCQVAQASPDGAVFLTSATPPAGTEIVAYLDEIGRLEAVTGDAVEGGFAVSFRVNEARRARIEARLRSLHGASPDPDEVARDPHDQPAGNASHIALPDGRVYPCRVLDVSTSGAAVEIDVIPALGTPILLGKMRGRVARYLENGVSIEFNSNIPTPTVPPQGR